MLEHLTDQSRHISPYNKFHLLIDNELKEPGDPNATAELVFMIMDNAFLQKNSRSITKLLQLYENAGSLEQKNDLAVAVLCCLSKRKAVAQENENGIGTKQVKSVSLLEEMACDVELGPELRTIALQVIAARANAEENHFFGVQAADYSLMASHYQKLYTIETKSSKDSRLIDAQQSSLNIIKYGIERALSSKDFVDREDGNNIASILSYPVQYACTYSLQKQAAQYFYHYIEQGKFTPSHKKSCLNSLNKAIANDFSEIEKTWLQNRIGLMQVEKNLDYQYHAFYYSSSHYNGRNEDALGDYEERVEGLEAILEPLKKATFEFRKQEKEFSTIPVPETFQYTPL